LQEFGSRAKTVAPFGGSTWFGIKKADLFHLKKIVEIGSGLVFLGKQVVISTGGKVVFTLPHFVAQPPCLEIGVNLFDTTVCPTTCDDSGEHHSKFPSASRKEREGGNPDIGEAKGDLEHCSGLIPVPVAIPGPLVSLPDVSFSQVGMMLDPSIVSRGGTDS